MRGDGDGGHEPAGPRLGIWGTFDLDNFGDLLFPRLFEHELVRRLPGAQVRAFSPLGWEHPLVLDGGVLAEPLGEPTPTRLGELADELDLVAIGGGEIVHTRDDVYAHYYAAPEERLARLRPSAFFIEGLGEAEARTPAAWHAVGIPFDLEGDAAERVLAALERRAYVTVRDEVSLDRLRRVGVERPVELVPDSAFVLDRLVPVDVRDRRLAFLRELGVYPAEPPLVLQGSRALVAHADAIARAVEEALEGDPSLRVVLLETGLCHGDGDFADVMAARLPQALRLPRELSVEDVVAAVAGAKAFAGISLHGNITALVFGVPSAILDLASYSKLAGFAKVARVEERRAASLDDVRRVVASAVSGVVAPSDTTPLVRRVDTHFDALAALAEQTWESRAARAGAPSPAAASLRALHQRYDTLRRAFAARRRQLERERVRLAQLEGGSRPDEEVLRRLAVAEEALERTRAELEHARVETTAARRAHEAALTEIARIEATRLFRYARPIRRAYARARGR